jgi:hypothetical protein
MDAAAADLLQEIVRAESLSLLAYVGDAFPWTAKGGDATLAKLRQIVTEHNREVTALGKLLARHRMAPPSLGSYPTSFTSINFLALSYILERLIVSERASVSLLEKEIARVVDTEARAALDHFLAAKRDHLARLEALASAPSAIAPTPAAS